MALPPPTWVEMEAFYPVLGWCELSAELLYTTASYTAGRRVSIQGFPGFYCKEKLIPN
jgi:hypothetical protein